MRRSLGNLCNLREIILSSNHWSQEISEILKSLSGCLSYSLEFLKLSHVQISSHLNNELGQFKNLLILSFWNNSISDPILESIRNLTSLRFLNLSYNRFNRTFPQNFGQLSKLTNLFIESNMLNGVVSEVHFSNLTRLNIFYAFENQLTLDVSHNWIPPFQIEDLSLRSWNLGPKFPSWLCSQSHLWVLDISNTRISDMVPSSFWNLSSNFKISPTIKSMERSQKVK